MAQLLTHEDVARAPSIVEGGVGLRCLEKEPQLVERRQAAFALRGLSVVLGLLLVRWGISPTGLAPEVTLAAGAEPRRGMGCMTTLCSW